MERDPRGISNQDEIFGVNPSVGVGFHADRDRQSFAYSSNSAITKRKRGNITALFSPGLCDIQIF